MSQPNEKALREIIRRCIRDIEYLAQHNRVMADFTSDMNHLLDFKDVKMAIRQTTPNEGVLSIHCVSHK